MLAIKLKIIALVTILLLCGCATNISGNVKLFDQNSRPIISDIPNGIVVNMINTSVSLQHASHSVTTDKYGNFETQGGSIQPGVYKIEVSKLGYKTATTTVKISSGNNKLELMLKKIQTRRSFSVESSDADKIINPGEVNIRPPSM